MIDKIAFLLLITLELLEEILFFYNIKFDEGLWKDKNSTLGKRSPRQRMLKNLLKKHKLNGMTKQEVLSLLGQPEDNITTEQELNYELGTSRGFFAVSTDILSIEFDQKDVAVSFRITV